MAQRATYLSAIFLAKLRSVRQPQVALNEMKTILILLALASLSGSSFVSSQENSDPFKSEFAIYCLKDTLITTAQALEFNLDSLELAAEPFLAMRDIKRYHWSTHVLDVQPRIDSILDKMSAMRYKSGGVPFVVEVGRQRIYLGTFWWYYSSAMPSVAYILMPTSHPSLSYNSFCRQPDRRSDKRIHDALAKAEKLIE